MENINTQADEQLRLALVGLRNAANDVLGMDLDLIEFDDLDELDFAVARANVALGEKPGPGYAFDEAGELYNVRMARNKGLT